MQNDVSNVSLKTSERHGLISYDRAISYVVLKDTTFRVLGLAVSFGLYIDEVRLIIKQYHTTVIP